jgi:hypothetical protein
VKKAFIILAALFCYFRIAYAQIQVDEKGYRAGACAAAIKHSLEEYPRDDNWLREIQRQHVPTIVKIESVEEKCEKFSSQGMQAVFDCGRQYLNNYEISFWRGAIHTYRFINGPQDPTRLKNGGAALTAYCGLRPRN